MQTLTEIVAAVVVHSSAAAYAHFGVPLEARQVEKPVPAERTIARTTPKIVAKAPDKPAVNRAKTPTSTAEDCPEGRAMVLRT